jgi:putative iron-regulated protein
MLTKNSRKNWLSIVSQRLLIALGILTISIVDIKSTKADPVKIANTSNIENLEAAVVRSFSDSVVIPTYQQLVEEADKLVSIVATFASQPSEENLQAARESWLTTRNPWEQSEAFAFGPASSLGYDGDLDDWPVNETDVTAVLKSNNSLTKDYVATLQTTQKGFHTIELLLFGTNNDKTADDFTPRELELLQVLTLAFQQSANDLTASWVKGVEGNPPYREVLASAGDPSNPAYPTVDAAVEEILQGIIGCLDEVANEKIGEPLETGDPLGFESRFSHNSLSDFKNNLSSVENAYLGTISDSEATGESLSDLIAAKNPELDVQVKAEMQQAIELLNEIPGPIETNITDTETVTKTTEAKNAIATLFETMQDRVLPVIK